MSVQESAYSPTCERCAELQAELDRLRDVARIDIENLQTELLVQKRVIAKQKREIAEMRDAETPPSEVERLLALWVTCRAEALNIPASRRKPDTAKGGKRWTIAQRAIKRWGFERCETVVKAGCANPYLHFGERVADPPEHDSKPWVDVEHLLGDEVRFERCEAAAERPVLTEQDRRDIAAIQRGTEAAQSRRPLPKLPTPPRPRGDVQTVLDALTQRGLAWRPSGHGRFSAQCPCHEDRTPSLGLVELEGGGVGAKCLGCQAGAWEVCEALGLHWSVFGKDEARAA